MADSNLQPFSLDSTFVIKTSDSNAGSYRTYEITLSELLKLFVKTVNEDKPLGEFNIFGRFK